MCGGLGRVGRIIKERNKTATCKPKILKCLIIDISKIKL
jgi:hypothetical protein